MAIDRTTKVILGLIAAGLWANIAAPFVAIAPAYAQMAESYLSNIDSNIGRIARGSCANGKLC
jgi:ABC-type methionine transport system permease subunit